MPPPSIALGGGVADLTKWNRPAPSMSPKAPIATPRHDVLLWISWACDVVRSGRIDEHPSKHC
jgi:hypothetical protein